MNMNEYKAFVDLAITEDGLFECNVFDNTNRDQYQFAGYLDDQFLNQVQIRTIGQAEELIDELLEIGEIDEADSEALKMKALMVIKRALDAGNRVISINYQVEYDESLIFLIK